MRGSSLRPGDWIRPGRGGGQAGGAHGSRCALGERRRPRGASEEPGFCPLPTHAAPTPLGRNRARSVPGPSLSLPPKPLGGRRGRAGFEGACAPGPPRGLRSVPAFRGEPCLPPPLALLPARGSGCVCPPCPLPPFPRLFRPALETNLGSWAFFPPLSILPANSRWGAERRPSALDAAGGWQLPSTGVWPSAAPAFPSEGRVPRGAEEASLVSWIDSSRCPQLTNGFNFRAAWCGDLQPPSAGRGPGPRRAKPDLSAAAAASGLAHSPKGALTAPTPAWASARASDLCVATGSPWHLPGLGR